MTAFFLKGAVEALPKESKASGQENLRRRSEIEGRFSAKNVQKTGP